MTQQRRPRIVFVALLVMGLFALVLLLREITLTHTNLATPSSRDEHNSTPQWRERLSIKITEDVNNIAFSSDGIFIAIVKEGKITIWDAATGAERSVCNSERASRFVNYLVFSSDGKLLATSGEDHALRIWNSHRGLIQLTLSGSGRCVAFQPHGNLVAFIRNNTALEMWDIIKRERVREFFVRAPVNSITFSLDGKQLAVGTGGKRQLGADVIPRESYTAGEVIVWDVAEAHEILRIRDRSTRQVLCVRFSPDGSQVLWSSLFGKEDDAVRGVAVKTQEEVFRLKSNHVLSLKKNVSDYGFVSKIVFSPDGKWLATLASDHSVNVWDIKTARTVYTLERQTGAVHSVAFSPTGKVVVLGTEEGFLKVWYVHDK